MPYTLTVLGAERKSLKFVFVLYSVLIPNLPSQAESGLEANKSPLWLSKMAVVLLSVSVRNCPILSESSGCPPSHVTVGSAVPPGGADSPISPDLVSSDPAFSASTIGASETVLLVLLAARAGCSFLGLPG